jgi:hypothetical protein
MSLFNQTVKRVAELERELEAANNEIRNLRNRLKVAEGVMHKPRSHNDRLRDNIGMPPGERLNQLTEEEFNQNLENREEPYVHLDRIPLKPMFPPSRTEHESMKPLRFRNRLASRTAARCSTSWWLRLLVHRIFYGCHYG